jgi:hypothetical protein
MADKALIQDMAGTKMLLALYVGLVLRVLRVVDLSSLWVLEGLGNLLTRNIPPLIINKPVHRVSLPHPRANPVGSSSVLNLLLILVLTGAIVLKGVVTCHIFEVIVVLDSAKFCLTLRQAAN